MSDFDLWSEQSRCYSRAGQIQRMTARRSGGSSSCRPGGSGSSWRTGWGASTARVVESSPRDFLVRRQKPTDNGLPLVPGNVGLAAEVTSIFRTSCGSVPRAAAKLSDRFRARYTVGKRPDCIGCLLAQHECRRLEELLAWFCSKLKVPASDRCRARLSFGTSIPGRFPHNIIVQ